MFNLMKILYFTSKLPVEQNPPENFHHILTNKQKSYHSGPSKSKMDIFEEHEDDEKDGFQHPQPSGVVKVLLASDREKLLQKHGVPCAETAEHGDHPAPGSHQMMSFTNEAMELDQLSFHPTRGFLHQSSVNNPSWLSFPVKRDTISKPRLEMKPYDGTFDDSLSDLAGTSLKDFKCTTDKQDVTCWSRESSTLSLHDTAKENLNEPKKMKKKKRRLSKKNKKSPYSNSGNSDDNGKLVRMTEFGCKDKDVMNFQSQPVGDLLPVLKPIPQITAGSSMANQHDNWGFESEPNDQDKFRKQWEGEFIGKPFSGFQSVPNRMTHTGSTEENVECELMDLPQTSYNEDHGNEHVMIMSRDSTLDQGIPPPGWNDIEEIYIDQTELFSRTRLKSAMRQNKNTGNQSIALDDVSDE